MLCWGVQEHDARPGKNTISRVNISSLWVVVFLFSIYFQKINSVDKLRDFVFKDSWKFVRVFLR